MKSYVQISIRTKRDTHEWRVGDAIISALSRNRHLVPERLSHNPDSFSDPLLDMSFCSGMWATTAELRVNGSMSEFHQDFCWIRRKPVRSSGCIKHTALNVRSQTVPGSLEFDSNWSDEVDWAWLFREWCGIIPPQLGMLHVFTEPELKTINKNGNFAIGSFGSALNPEVPGVGWAMFYGDEFSTLIDPSLITESGFILDRMDNGYLVCVTNDINDVLHDYGAFCERRERLKSILPWDMPGK